MSRHIESIIKLIDQEITNTQKELESLNEHSAREEIDRMLIEYFKRKGREMIKDEERKVFIKNIRHA